MDFYKKKKQFLGSADDDWKQHLAQLITLRDEYGSDDQKNGSLFVLTKPREPGLQNLYETDNWVSNMGYAQHQLCI